jgi:hypothetical protein
MSLPNGNRPPRNSIRLEAEPVPEEVSLRFRARFALSADKTSIHIGNKSEGSALHPYDFYCGAWMGADSPHLSFTRLKPLPDGSGEAAVDLRLSRCDVDVLKLGLFVHDPDTGVNRHVLSGFQSLSWIADSLKATDFDSAHQSMSIEDNYTPNQALLHFCNDSTDLDSLRALVPHLKRSILHDNSQINAQVMALTFGVHDFIQRSSNVSPLNGGANFVKSTCFTQCMGCAINYPLLDMIYSSDKHLAPLSMLAYMGIATVHGSGHSPEALLALSDPEFMTRFVVPLTTSFTVCTKTSVYSGDETISPEGKLNLATEDFAMVMSTHNYLHIKKAFVDQYDASKLRAMSTEELCDHIKMCLSRKGKQDSDGHTLISDDCETLAGLVKSIEGSLRKYHLSASAGLGGGCSPEEGDMALARSMWDETRSMANLSAVPLQDFQSVGRLMGRYARLRKNCEEGKSPAAQMGLSIVSAKGPSFSKTNRQLSGHACVVAQTLSASGEANYAVAEGTSHLMMRNLPKGCPKEVTVPLTDGSKQFETTEALAILAENLAGYIKTCGKTRVREYIPHSFDGKDPYDTCPFYMAGFFVGLQMDSLTPGVIPLEQRGGTGLRGEMKQSKPLFGAPVVALSGDNVTAMPINLGKVFGEKEGRALLDGLALRRDETSIGRAPKEVLERLMSAWGPLTHFDSKDLCCDPNHTWVCSASESFGNGEVLRGVLEYKTRLARKFNSVQAGDPKGDGVTMVVKAHMMSAVSHFYVPLPTQEVWGISSARSMQKAVATMPKISGEVALTSDFKRMAVSD